MALDTGGKASSSGNDNTKRSPEYHIGLGDDKRQRFSDVVASLGGAAASGAGSQPGDQSAMLKAMQDISAAMQTMTQGNPDMQEQMIQMMMQNRR